jgi:hypothetical protein
MMSKIALNATISPAKCLKRSKENCEAKKFPGKKRKQRSSNTMLRRFMTNANSVTGKSEKRQS